MVRDCSCDPAEGSSKRLVWKMPNLRRDDLLQRQNGTKGFDFEWEMQELRKRGMSSFGDIRADE